MVTAANECVASVYAVGKSNSVSIEKKQEFLISGLRSVNLRSNWDIGIADLRKKTEIKQNCSCKKFIKTKKIK